MESDFKTSVVIEEEKCRNSVQDKLEGETKFNKYSYDGTALVPLAGKNFARTIRKKTEESRLFASFPMKKGQ